ncbi:5'/3'-nucleotidase SurE [Desulfobacter hydrogenophilus]|uniref:5'-nucleotidase SurE n=1 Tax=Desulfobacter hydrogenophilus TaxID=2291 RepID=A0A328FF11_9BACT|nr:5'/3'-nucleotidase SurE [Desulfobacter hydrogenophilus]NDY71922.1 5'/3'-nucleotidase SurE [Desulfobacter hydrogenophilus]QBH12385.1 5'/3'-nucleotidase SurE [Desulfobacter hydrogenophilus]RAM02012.1 5'/3'-nucleotidase SurE [Desulfobacter hydrogenophilus]
MKILVTNDDGYQAPGIRALFNALNSDHEVTLAAPDREKSAVGHGITLHTPLKHQKVRLGHNNFGHAVTGNPADCVKLALFDICDQIPDLVISGINAGSNTGLNINYSGTVGAAREAAINKIPAIAVSIQYGETMDFQGIAAYTASILDKAMDLNLPPGVFLNINAPAISFDRIAGTKVTAQADNNLINVFDRRLNPRDLTYYWYAGMEQAVPCEGSDNSALLKNYISITPLQCDMTAHAAIDVVAKADF